MAQIIYSSEYNENSNLFKLIKQKHDADLLSLAGSKITPYLNEHGIDLTVDAADVTAADAADVLAQKLQKNAENLRVERDLLIDPAFIQHRKMVQALKKLKAEKVHELGDWGQTVNGVGRIVYPSEFIDLKKCIKDFIDKHNSLPPANSPLKGYLDEHPAVDLAQTLLDLDAAQVKHDAFKQMYKDMETQTATRDTKFENPFKHVRGIGQYLSGIFDFNKKKLGDWGYTVDEVERKEKLRTFELTGDTSKTVRGAVLFSEIENKGTVPVNIYRGKGLEGLPFTLLPGHKFPVKFGYGTFTIYNPDPDGHAIINATIART